jgi:hypothetical protein
MNFDLIANPLTIYGVLAAGGIAALHLVISTRIELRRQETCHLAETESLRAAIAALEAKVQEVCAQMRKDVLPPAAHKPFPGISDEKRAEALRMYERGSDQHAIGAALGLPQAEVALLEKVHHYLSGSAADLKLNETSGHSSRAFSSYETCSPEA